ncbi:MAG: hypothetical protein A2066_14135 [Bacteroidetes bacterium GWB2_41_8]|nr:MAG: hypothetical protein A2066_14135 [Bacteroidetes bacterium GWB2_41_8]
MFVNSLRNRLKTFCILVIIKTKTNEKKWIIILISILFSSCEKGDDSIIKRNSNGLLSRILISGELYQEFTYTNSGLIYEEKSCGTYIKYTYNSDNQLERQDYYIDPALYSSSMQVITEAQKRKEWANPNNVPKSVTNTYSYPKTGQFIERYVDRTNGTQSYAKYELNEKGLVSKQIFYDDDKPTGYIDYLYDGQGNLTRKMHYFISADGKSYLSNETEYEFDNKRNPYFPFKKLLNPGLYTNLNNITKETYTLYGELPVEIERVQITTHTYEYNESGYPIKVDGIWVYEY